ncbi:MAG: mannose-6-phosphate isomerase, class I [Candidatus Pacebacteria bacterium]|nr:mannose-6-phosphate isomerase, class I [Candidatus Paceibacterota bacterium]
MIKTSQGMNFARLFELQCGVQHYAWGVRAHDGRVPFIAELTGADADDERFAELWIGAHPKCPASVMTDEGAEALDGFIHKYAHEILGRVTKDGGVRHLPFLLKVLDIQQPLSIQAHPDKRLAEKLHARDPEHYPDANHKPEIAVSLRGLDALCQFRKADAIKCDLRRLSPLAGRFGELLADGQAPDEMWLRHAYGRLFALSNKEAGELVAETRAFLCGLKERTPADGWFLRLTEVYPGDRGALSVYFLNIIHLDPGEAIFLGADEPHAYLQGTIIECMASSDNVVRAGLTEKFVDTKVLTDMLTYRQGPPPVFSGEELCKGERVYRVPVAEFQVEFYSHGAGKSRSYPCDCVPSLILVLEGSAEFRVGDTTVEAPKGSTWLWPAALASCGIRYLEPATTIVRARPNIDLDHRP